MINIKAFKLLAGQPEAWDREVIGFTRAGGSLTEIQERQHAKGRRSAEMMRSLYGWHVRSASGLEGFALLYSSPRGEQIVSPDKGFATAYEWGVAWANEGPLNREFYIRRSVMERYPDEIGKKVREDPGGQGVSHKEPWQETKDDYLTRLKERGADETSLERLAVAHKTYIRMMIAEGKPVPAEVLADYPDLAAKAKPVTPGAVPEVKEPWQMTRGEFEPYLREQIDSARAPGDPNAPAVRLKDQENFAKLKKKLNIPDLQWTDAWNPARRHKLVVERALAEGKPVPPLVLKDYPDLAGQAGPVTRGKFAIRRDRLGSITVTRPDEPQKSVYLQFEADQETVRDILRPEELRDLDAGWTVEVSDGEPRASILRGLWEGAETETAGSPQGPFQITKDRIDMLYKTQLGSFLMYRDAIEDAISDKKEGRVPGTGTLRSFTVDELRSLKEYADELHYGRHHSGEEGAMDIRRGLPRAELEGVARHFGVPESQLTLGMVERIKGMPGGRGLGASRDGTEAMRIAEEAAVKASELTGTKIAEQVARELSGEILHQSPVSPHCERVLTEPPLCYDFRGIRSWVLCKAWDTMEKEKRLRLPVGEAWAEARRVCRID